MEKEKNMSFINKKERLAEEAKGFKSILDGSRQTGRKGQSGRKFSQRFSASDNCLVTRIWIGMISLI